MFTKESFLANSKPKRDLVEVVIPEMGDAKVSLRYPTAAEWFRIVSRGKRDELPTAEDVDRLTEAAAICLANADGSRMFKDEDEAQLRDIDPSVLLALYAAILNNVLNVKQRVEDVQKN